MASTADPPSPYLGMASTRVVIDNEASDDATVIRVDSVDSHGTLLEFVQVISDLRLVIHKACIYDGNHFVHVFHVTDREGNKVLDEATISYIQKMLEFDNIETEMAKQTMAKEKPHERVTGINVDEFQGTEDKFVFQDVIFSVASSPKGGIAIKFGSNSLVHLPKQCSARHPVVQMILLATSFSYGDTFGRQRSGVAKTILHIMEKSSSISCTTDAPSVFQAGWVTPKQHTAKSCNGEAYALGTAPSRTPGHGYWMPVLWLDSGAAHHVVGDARILTNLRDPPAGSAETVTVADGSELPVVMVGDIWTEHFRIEDVYLVPGLQMNLVSVRQLARRRIFSTFCESHADLVRGHEQVGGAIADDDTSLYRLRFLKAI